MEPVEGSFAPELLVARNPEEGARAADRSPVPGPATVLREWDEYGKRALVVVLGGSQPDSSYRVVLSSIGFIREGTALLAGGRIGQSGEAAASVISTPWIVVSVNAGAADVVSRCILALAGQDTRSTSCP